jgi:gluconolactonase
VAADGSLYVSDLGAGVIRHVRLDGTTEVLAETGGGPNGIARGPGGALYVANNGGISWTDGQVDLSAPPPSHSRIERIDHDGTITELYRSIDGRPLGKASDMAIDTTGAIWFTDPGHNALKAPAGHILRAEADGSAIGVVASGCVFPNGVAFVPDAPILVVAETGAGAVFAYDVVGGGRQLTSRREFARLPKSYYPDGMCFDRDGNLVVAGTFGGGVIVFDPEGKLIDTIPLDDPLTTSVAFGRPERDELFVTQARTGSIVRLKWPCPGADLPFDSVATW